ncbi:polysaccharide deacetylase family protein [Neobacillus vireti]|uniref:polysaccharide deacetylase family protein n=1 Tax=Neobacillus vireti TaxID=220686 RepID=UPI003000641D
MLKRGSTGSSPTYKRQNSPNEKGIIFEDTSNVKIVFFVVIILMLSTLLMVFLGLSQKTFLPSSREKGMNEFSSIQPIKGETTSVISYTDTSANQTFLKMNIEKNTDFYAFYVNWDQNSKTSLNRHIDQIDVLIPEWFQLGADLELKDDIQQDVGKLAKEHHAKVMPLINNVVNGEWNQEIVHQLLHSPTARTRLINDLKQQIIKYGYDGINIDFEFTNPSDRDLMTSFMSELYQSFHNEGLLVTIDVQPANHSYDLTNLEKYCDQIILMLYDENMLNPGPISSQSWYLENLSKTAKDKLIVSLGNYGYDWDWETGQAGKVVSFEETMRMAEKAHLNVQWDDMSKSPYIRYETNNKIHELWFLDSVTFYNQWKAALSNGVKGIALWRLGTEDPSVWNVIGGSKTNTLLSVKNGDTTYNYGKGSILRFLRDEQEGKRSLIFDDSGLIKGEAYLSFPEASEIKRLSNPSTEDKTVVLSFDDGPDPAYTKKILEILKEYHIKATFFIIGKDAILHQDIVKRIYTEGHEIGNHTFSHPNIYKISDQQLKWELNTNERLIEAITGHSTMLYRSPYGDDFNMYNGEQQNPYVRSQFQRLMEISQMGYMTVNYDVDSSDWKLNNSKDIVENVMKQVTNGDIILFHDGGGDRSATVQALPEIIEKLKNQGYRFKTVSGMMNEKQESVSPGITSAEKPYIQTLKIALQTVFTFKKILLIVFYGALSMFLLRLILFLYLAWRHKKRSLFANYDECFNPFVSVVIAAYNEEKVISRTIQAVLDSTYDHFEVIIIDDGSKDRTSSVVTSQYSTHAKVRLLSKRNAGKASAINLGVSKAKGDIIVAIDADTIISPEAISLLVRHFKDEKVAAVSGNVRVGNVRNLLTTWQHIEYVTGFNLEKRAYAILNCVTVVPGAIGSWRKRVIEKLGGFTDDTLAEDTDLTLRILNAGYQVAIEEKAYAYTEAPENSRDFLKQRFRWSFGTLQCLWKHKKAFWRINHKSLDFIALPSILMFQFIVPFFAPVLDLIMIFGFINGNIKESLIFYVGYFIVDFLICCFALKLEKSNLTPLWSLFLQRILYRYLLMWVSWKSIFKAIKGGRVGWGKLERTGNIEVVRKVG